jgi:hypothetical protein
MGFVEASAFTTNVEARGVEQFLQELRGELKAGTFQPLPVRERMMRLSRSS